MRRLSGTLLCATLALAPAGCARQDAATTAPATVAPGETRFEVTPAVAATTGVTAVVALGVLAIVACGIACAQ